jgi:hypothetical protein
MIRSSRRARHAVSVISAVVLGASLVLGSVACSGDDSSTDAVLDQVAPTKADVAAQADIDFPASTEGFRLVRISADQIDLTFTIATADIGAFSSGSKLTLTGGSRVITHASPLWDVAIVGEFEGGESVRNTVKRSAEVVPAGDRATVRLTLLRQS